jgi:hypothetical protein
MPPTPRPPASLAGDDAQAEVGFVGSAPRRSCPHPRRRRPEPSAPPAPASLVRRGGRIPPLVLASCPTCLWFWPAAPAARRCPESTSPPRSSSLLLLQ